MRTLVAYVGETAGDGMGVEKHGTTSRRHITDWNGKSLGTCFLGNGWPIRSCIGNRMFQIYAKIDGREYTGRGFGEGMSVVLRETAASRKTKN